MMFQPTIAITAGDPCGIGPEVLLKTLPRWRRAPRMRVVIIGDEAVFHRTARRLGCRVPRWRLVPAQSWRGNLGAALTLLDCGHRGSFPAGRTSRQAGAASLAYLAWAIRLWRGGAIQGLVTAPVTKWAIAASAKPGFTGQTEYLARAMGVRDAAMMFVSDRLRVVLLTRHLPLGRVSRAITPHLLRRTLWLTRQALRDQFRISRPRLALCGLNPHAGEEGHIGSEERLVILPVLRALRREGIICDGPFAADGFFARPSRYDAVVCAYHDQGLIPFKMLARDRGCQLSLGLPIVRTSPDHGSALDIAGRGIANPGSMLYAVQLAAKLVSR